jgi:sugar (pentulose or hexulose) kinase
MFQGLARIEAAGYAKLQEQGAPKIQHIVTNGGGSKNIVWQKLRERVIRMPISQALQTQAAYGSALACLDNLRKNPSK